VIKRRECMILGFIGGIFLGFIFFGGLYWSVNKLPEVKYPAVLMITSALVRMAILLAGIYFIAGNDIKKILSILLGVVLVKIVMIFTVKNKSAS